MKLHKYQKKEMYQMVPGCGFLAINVKANPLEPTNEIKVINFYVDDDGILRDMDTRERIFPLRIVKSRDHIVKVKRQKKSRTVYLDMENVYPDEETPA